MARIYLEIGDNDRALEWLEKAFEERESVLIFLKVNPTYDNLHPDPRFANLIARIGFKP